MIVLLKSALHLPPTCNSVHLELRFTVTACLCWVTQENDEIKAQKTYETSRRSKAKKRSNTKRTDITGEICNYVDWNHRIVVGNIAHTNKVAGGREEERKMYVTLKQKRRGSVRKRCEAVL